MSLAAAVIGRDARWALSPGTGEIIAVFHRSFYVGIGGRLACCGSAEIGCGPLNVVLRGVRGLDWRTLLTAGRAAAVRDDRLLIDGQSPIGLAGAAIWEPQPTPSWSLESVAAGLAELDRLLAIIAPQPTGLGCFARTGGKGATPVAQAAEAPIRALAEWLTAGCPDCEKPPVEALLGLGPGLTPSGDDFIAGLLGALRGAGRLRCAQKLWSVVEACLDSCTHAISAAHVRAAAEGRLAAAQHDLLNALLIANRTHLRRNIDRLAQESHSSSWDGLAGIVTALRTLARPGR